ncbi:MAG: hypothetical protein KAJ45_03435, partial [Desulfobulbaceae bacterium]|nr:hypothetical protein [Desulfobulbaceae bacterium]
GSGVLGSKVQSFQRIKNNPEYFMGKELGFGESNGKGKNRDAINPEPLNPEPLNLYKKTCRYPDY